MREWSLVRWESGGRRGGGRKAVGGEGILVGSGVVLWRGVMVGWVGGFPIFFLGNAGYSDSYSIESNVLMKNARKDYSLHKIGRLDFLVVTLTPWWVTQKPSHPDRMGVRGSCRSNRVTLTTSGSPRPYSGNPDPMMVTQTS